MKRLHGAFVALALLLLLPSALLVRHALAGARAEREARHRALAERVFDEMERALSELVSREEARPFDAWRAQPGSAGGLTTSPLAAPPAEPYVLGYFQRETDGRFTAPLLASPSGVGGVAAARAEQARSLASAWLAAPAPLSKDTALRQPPGTTVSLERAGVESLRALGYAEPKKNAPEAKPEFYDAFQSLNQGAKVRSERQRKTLEESAADAYGDREQRSAAAAPAAAGGVAQEAPAEPAVRIDVDPFVGRAVDAEHLLLYRTVLIGREAVRQGLVLETGALADALRARALDAARLPGASLTLASAASSVPPAQGGFVYRHRFAEPFDGLAAELALPALPGTGSERSIHALSALLLLVGAGGLLAIHRMVSVRLAFAEQRSSFVAAVTHELKTPLTAIRMYGEMLRDGLVGEAKRQEYYGTITAESERLSRLIDNVLEFSRLEKGTRVMNVEVGDIAPVVEEAAAWLRPHVERAGFVLRVASAPDLPPVRFERDALRQVLVNLIDNALKYARDAQQREIRVECRRQDGGVVLSVGDRGPGVAGRHLKRVFEPFYRGEDELTRTTQGTGLGLALVASLIQRMGGVVSGRNGDGGGFEVSIALRP